MNPPQKPRESDNNHLHDIKSRIYNVKYQKSLDNTGVFIDGYNSCDADINIWAIEIH